MTSNDGMTIPESFDGSNRKSKKMNAAKKTPRKTKIALKYTVKTKKPWPQEPSSDTMLNISIDTLC